MSYDSSRDYISIPDGHGGVTASLRRPLRVLTKDGRTVPYERSFLPGRIRDAASDVPFSFERNVESEWHNTRRNTLFLHHPAPGERLELEEREGGGIALVLISPTTPEITPPPVLGAGGMKTSDAARLRAQNEANRLFWNPKK